MADRDPLETVTHARLRAGQGDVRGARRILERVLERRPGDEAARALLGDLDGRRHVEPTVRAEPVEPPPVAARAGDLADRFRAALDRAPEDRAARLRRWLQRIESGRALDRGAGGER